MSHLRSRRRGGGRPGFAQAVVVAGVLGAVAGPAWADAGDDERRIPSVEATLSIGPVTVPEKKRGGKELQFAWGKDVAGTAHATVRSALADAAAFSELVDAGGTWQLSMIIESASREYDDLTSVDQTSHMTFTLEVVWAWARDGKTLHEGRSSFGHRIPLDRAPWKSDLDAGWKSALRKAALEAFGNAHDAGAFGTVKPARRARP